MNRNEVIDLLSIITALDRRTTGEADIQAWMLVLPQWLDFQLACEAVREYWQTPSKDMRQNHWIDPLDVQRFAKIVKERREVEKARQRSLMSPEQRRQVEREEEQARIRAIDAKVATEPPALSPMPEYDVEQLAANRRKLSEMMNLRQVPKSDA